MLIACLVLCILFSVAGITAAEVDDKAINEDSNVVSEVAVPEVDNSVATEVSEDTNDVSENNLTASVETNEADDGSTESQSSDVVDTKAASNNVADNKVVGNTVVDNKDAQIVSATTDTEVVGYNIENKWYCWVESVTFSNNQAIVNVEYLRKKSGFWLKDNYVLVDGVIAGYWAKFTNTPQHKFITLPDSLKLTPGTHIITMMGILMEDDDHVRPYAQNWTWEINDTITSFAPNFNKQTLTYEEALTIKPTGIGANYGDFNPSYMKYDLYIDGIQKQTGKNLNEAFTIPDKLSAGSHKISFRIYGNNVNEAWFDYYVNVNKGGVNFVIENGFGTETSTFTLKTTTTAKSGGRQLSGKIYVTTDMGQQLIFDATGSINFGTQSLGTHTMNATFVPDDSNFVTSTCRFIIDVSRNSLRVLSEDQEYGNDIIIKLNSTETGSFTVKDFNTGKVVAKINYNTPLVWQDIKLGKLATGSYPFVVINDETGEERTARLNVLKATPTSNITIDRTNTIYLDSNFIHGKLTGYNITGLIEYYVDGVKVGDGNLTGSQFDLGELEVGTHTIKVLYNGDFNYEGTEETFNLIVVPKTIEWTFDYVPTNYPEKPMAAFSTNVASGYYEFTINNKTYVRVARSGVIVIDFDVLPAGTYMVENITFSDSHNYNLPFTPFNFTIGQTNPELIIDFPEESQFGAPKEIVTTTNYDLMNLTGNITYSISAPFVYQKTVAVGEPVDLTHLPVGTYEVYVDYSGDDNYASVGQYINLTVTKADVHYIFTPNEIKYTYEGQEYVLNATGFFELDPATGYYVYNDIVFVNDTFVFNVTMFDQSGNPVTNGTARVYENGRLIGNATIGQPFEYHAIRGDRLLRFEYEGDENHNALTKEVQIEVYENEIGISVDNVLYSQNAIGVISVSKPGTYVIRVGDNTYEVVVNSRLDYPTVNLGILPAKETEYVAYIQEKGGTSIFSNSFYVYKNVADLIPVADIKGMDDAIITVTSEDYNITGDLEFYNNGELIHTMKYGEVFNISSFDFGHYDLVIKLVNDPNYKDETVNLSFDKKFQASVELSVQDISFGDVEEIKIFASKDGYYMVTVGEDTYKVTVYQGKGFLTLGWLNAGNYNVTAVIDDAIYQGNASASFTVLKTVATVGVEVADVIFGDNATITLTSTIDGTYNVTVDGMSYDVEIDEGVGYLSIENLPVGNYDVIAELRNDNIIATGKGAFAVFYNSPFSIEIENYTYKQNGTITVRSAHDGLVTVNVYNATDLVATYEVTVTDGTGSFVIEDALDVADYTVDAEFVDSEGYTTYNTTAFKVDQANPNIQITADDIAYGANVTVVISADLAGTYNVTFNGNLYEVTLDDETKTGNITFEDLLPGKYNVFVEYGDKNYYGNASDDVVVNYNNVIDSINIPDYYYEQSSVLVIKTQTPGTYDVYIDGVKYSESITVAEGSTTGSIEITDIDVGDHVVFVTYIAADGTAFGANTTFKVSPVLRNVNFTIEDSIYGSDAKVTVYADEDGDYTITINNETYSVTVVNGEGNTTISGVDAAKSIVATISIDSPNYVATNTTTFKVLPKDIDVRIVVSNITYGEDALVTVFAEVDGVYLVKFNNIDGVFTVNVTDGQGSIYVSGLDVESNLAEVKMDSSNYNGSNTVEFTVSPKEISVNMAVTDITFGDEAIVSVVADVDDVYMVKFNNIDGIFIVTVKDHVGNLHVPGLNVDTNTAYINISNNNYIGLANATFTVSPRATVITAPDVAKVYNVGKNYVVYLKDNQGKALANAAVSVKIGSKTYNKITDASGKVTIAIENLKPATYKTTITFAGDKNYAASSLTTSQIVVKKANPKLTASSKTYKVSATKKYVATLKSNTNKAIKGATLSLKVNGKTYKAKTNAKGQATFKITNLKKKGSYVATVSFNKDAYYNAASKKVKIVVK